MKLSFSFTKTAAPKRTVVSAQVADNSEIKREVVAVSHSSGILTQSTAVDQEAQVDVPLVIPCKSSYSRPSKNDSIKAESSNEELSKLQNQPGLISKPKCDVVGMNDESAQPNIKKARTSILMQIREARVRGEVRDAADELIHKYDADDFAWGLLRGMGYDETKDSGPDVTKDVIGNRSKLGLGVKMDTFKLPTELGRKN